LGFSCPHVVNYDLVFLELVKGDLVVEITLRRKSHIVSSLSSHTVCAPQLSLILALAMNEHELSKLISILLTRQPSFDLFDVDTQPESNTRGANTVDVKLRHQCHLLRTR